MGNLVIKGHATRGREVIELLEMLGGINFNNHDGCRNMLYFISTNKGEIMADFIENNPRYTIFTLEEFLEKFPYKVGDTVLYEHDDKTFFIRNMFWKNDKILYELSDECYSGGCSVPDTLLFDVDVINLQPYKEETMKEKRIPPYMDYDVKAEETMEGVYYNGEINCYHQDFEDKVRIRLGGDFEIKVEDGKTYVVRKNPKYPKTYDECCEELGHKEIIISGYVLGYKGSLLSSLQKLLICRDAYWKIAGEQMGLGKPWEPDWLDTNTQKYCIYYVGDEIKKQPMLEVHHFLTFPSKEMRDAFYENFKDLIDACKELL